MLNYYFLFSIWLINGFKSDKLLQSNNWPSSFEILYPFWTASREIVLISPYHVIYITCLVEIIRVKNLYPILILPNKGMMNIFKYLNWYIYLYLKRRDQLTMSYFDNLNNESLNKYKKYKKYKKWFFYRCVFLLLNWWSFKFHSILLSFGSPSKTVKLKPL
jgi:hypothetical protein